MKRIQTKHDKEISEIIEIDRQILDARFRIELRDRLKHLHPEVLDNKAKVRYISRANIPLIWQDYCMRN